VRIQSANISDSYSGETTATYFQAGQGLDHWITEYRRLFSDHAVMAAGGIAGSRWLILA
jgi:hypothetical protein